MECIEQVETFKYPGRMLDWSGDNWLAVHQNFGKAHRVWIQLGKLIRRDRAEPQVSAMFYQVVINKSITLLGGDLGLVCSGSW